MFSIFQIGEKFVEFGASVTLTSMAKFFEQKSNLCSSFQALADHIKKVSLHFGSFTWMLNYSNRGRRNWRGHGEHAFPISHKFVYEMPFATYRVRGIWPPPFFDSFMPPAKLGK